MELSNKESDKLRCSRKRRALFFRLEEKAMLFRFGSTTRKFGEAKIVPKPGRQDRSHGVQKGEAARGE